MLVPTPISTPPAENVPVILLEGRGEQPPLAITATYSSGHWYGSASGMDITEDLTLSPIYWIPFPALPVKK
jgi:hypothetical protein